MIEVSKEWLSKHFNVKPIEIEKSLQNHNVTGFLIVWTLYEQRLFKGYMRYTDLENYALDNSNEYQSDFDSISKHFHSRYQNKKRYKNLIHNDNYNKIKSIVDKDYKKLSLDEKLLFILYVVYRFRNNIFHGTKGINSWLRYKLQIEKCITIMTKMIEAKNQKQ